MKDDMSIFLLSFAPSRKLQRICIALGAFISIGIFLRVVFTEKYRNPRRVSFEAIKIEGSQLQPPKIERITKTFVVASRQNDDTLWVRKSFLDWQTFIYITDNSTGEEPTVPVNKGREAMVYLTWIIDHYDHLPSLVVFIHSERYQWHNDDPIYDGVAMLKNLQLPYILEHGYVNLRCVWTLGCPSEIKLNEPVDDPSKTTELAYPQAFGELFPGKEPPHTVGVPCCAQFAVSRSTILSNPLSAYIHYRNWLIETPLGDHISGRIFEYSWHMIFGKPPVYCLNAESCYCNLYGYCNLKCEEDAKCGNRWPFPPSATLPDGWPITGWDGEKRNLQEVVELRNVEVDDYRAVEGVGERIGLDSGVFVDE